MTALAASMVPLTPYASYATHLPPTGAALAPIRKKLGSFLRKCRVDAEVAYWTVLVADELFTNAVVHGKPSPEGTVSVRLTLHGLALEVSVYDADPTPPCIRTSGDEEESGRGLVLVDTFAVDWGSERLTDGKRVWAQLCTKP